MEYARSLRMLKAGWTTDLRTAYFEWFLKAANYRGGASFEKFIEFIRNGRRGFADAMRRRRRCATCWPRNRRRSRRSRTWRAMFAGRTPTHWTLEELRPPRRQGLKERNFENGRQDVCARRRCFTCHRFGNEGGMTGPDLTAAVGRYSPHDFLDQIINPSKEINEQFSAVTVVTEDGKTYTGVVVNLSGDSITLNTDLTDPNLRVGIDRKKIEEMKTSTVSPMPVNLLSLLTKDEVLDLTAYVLSGGDPGGEYFRK